MAKVFNRVSMIDLQDLGHLDWKGLSACVCEKERERERESEKYPSEKYFHNIILTNHCSYYHNETEKSAKQKFETWSCT